MGSWWAFCIQKEGLEFGQKMKGIFGLILYEPSWARKRRLYDLWLLSGASKPSQGFSPFLEGKSIILKINVETSFDLYILTTAAYDKIV